MSDRKKAFWFIALLSVLVVVPFLGETIFYSKGEPREAIVALSMLESGNWILPVNYGTDIAYKPPFFYWSIAAVSSLFGEVTEFSARFPSALAFLAMQLMFFAFVAKRKNRSNGVSGLYSSFSLFFRGWHSGSCRLSGRYGSGCLYRYFPLSAVPLG